MIGLMSNRSAEKYTPKVTCLSVPSTEMGRMGAEFLINQLEGQNNEPQQVILTPQLTVHKSTARFKKRK
jgi:DNA-binding LacI/PurR family transcriptional regulator